MASMSTSACKAEHAEAIGTLMIHVIRAEHLKEKGWTGTQDPYLTVSLGKSRHSGPVITDGGTEPMFNSYFFFVLQGKEIDAELIVLDKKIVHSRTIGKLRLDILRMLTASGPTWYKLEGDCGNLLIECQFRGTLRGQYMNNMDEANYAMAMNFEKQQQMDSKSESVPATYTAAAVPATSIAPSAGAAPVTASDAAAPTAQQRRDMIPPAGAVGTMVVHLMRGQNLKDRNWMGGKQDPFVSLELGPDGWQQQKSQVVKEGGTDPLFDQKFVFNLDGRENTLDMHVYDKGALMNKTIGKAYIPIERLVDGGASNWFELEDGRGLIQMRTQFRGHLRGREIDNMDEATLAPVSQPHVSATSRDNVTGVAPFATGGPGYGAVGSLVIHAIRAERLKDKEWKGGKQDPYLVFELGPHSNQRQETSVISQGGTEPIFDQKFLFNLEGKETTLDVHAYHKGSVLKHSIGKCYIPLDALLTSDSPRWFHLENEGGSIQLRAQFRGTVRGSSIDTIQSDTLAVYPSSNDTSSAHVPGGPVATSGATGLEQRMGSLSTQPPSHA